MKSEAELQGLRDAAEREGVALFLDIGASWCGPCRRIAPVFEVSCFCRCLWGLRRSRAEHTLLAAAVGALDEWRKIQPHPRV